jgi:hypothetical protein
VNAVACERGGLDGEPVRGDGETPIVAVKEVERVSGEFKPVPWPIVNFAHQSTATGMRAAKTGQGRTHVRPWLSLVLVDGNGNSSGMAE